MQRREFMATVGTAAAIASVTGKAFAENAETAAPAGGKNHGLIHSGGHCVVTGEECLAHCLDMFAKGDTSLAQCAKSVNQLVIACRSLQEMAASNSPYLPAMSKVALAVCADCEKECRKHEEHVQCKNCADACKECAEECRKLAA
jgi:Cys-rich four helix bundle protein (predicted Tat secretion target)